MLQKFRKKYQLGEILKSKHPNFEFMKSVYNHGFIGRAKNGTPVFIDHMGGFHETMKQFRRHNISDDEVIRHSQLIMEWFCEKIDPRPYPGGRFIRVYDFAGLKISHAKDIHAIRLGKKIIEMIDNHYPERLELAFAINAPTFLDIFWKVSLFPKPCFPESFARGALLSYCLRL